MAATKFLRKGGGLDVFERSGRFYVRYDAGAHILEMREDEVSREEAVQAAESADGANKVILAFEVRLISQGIDPYKSNL
jgi:hypothetical protein